MFLSSYWTWLYTKTQNAQDADRLRDMHSKERLFIEKKRLPKGTLIFIIQSYTPQSPPHKLLTSQESEEWPNSC